MVGSANFSCQRAQTKLNKSDLFPAEEQKTSPFQKNISKHVSASIIH